MNIKRISHRDFFKIVAPVVAALSFARLIKSASKTPAGPTQDADSLIGNEPEGHRQSGNVATGQKVCVPNFEQAELPTPGRPGCLARVTDDTRGLWMDNGVNWESVSGHSINVLNYTSLEAAITDIGSATRTLLIPVQVTVTADVMLPANVTLWFVNSGQLSINNGITVTLTNPPIASKRQIFAGEGSIAWSRPPGVIDPIWWGAVYDDKKDDAPAIQAAIDSMGSIEAERRAGTIVQISGPAAIASTILVRKKAPIIQGLGNGYYGVTTPTQPYLRWIGPAGQSMIRIQDTSGARIRNLRFIGQPSAPPSAAISLYETEDGIPTFLLMFENIEISNNGFGGVGFQNGIHIEGTSSIQNDSSLWLNIYIDGCIEAGIRIGGIQNINHNFHNLFIRNCKHAMRIAGAVNVEGMEVARNEIDFYVPNKDDHGVNTGPIVQVKYLSSEGSGRLVEWEGDGQFYLNGGYWQIGTRTNSDGKIIKADNDLDQLFHLAHFAFTQNATPPHAPYISMVHSGNSQGRPAKRLYLEHVTGLEEFLQGGTDDTPFNFGPPVTPGAHYFVDCLYPKAQWNGSTRVTEFIVTRNILTHNRGYAKNRFDHHNRSSVPNAIQEMTTSDSVISASSEIVLISNISGSEVTLTSAPTIPDGEDGQFMTIVNVGTDNVVLQDQGALTNSNLRLTGNTVTLGPRHSIALVYLRTVADVGDAGDWVQTGNVVAVR